MSKHGTTEKVAGMITDKLALGGEVKLISLRENAFPDIREFERIVLGTSLYAGSPAKQMARFYKKNGKELLSKALGLFVCGMETDPQKREELLGKAYPKELTAGAQAILFAGGEILMEKMNFIERFIMKKITKSDRSLSMIDYEGIDRFIEEMR